MKGPPRPPEYPARDALNDFRADLAQYRQRRRGASWPSVVLTSPGLWASADYRFGRWLLSARVPGPLDTVLAALRGVCHPGVELLTGIRLPPRSRVGPGLYIPHFGGIVLHENVIIGSDCILGHDVTLGTRGPDRLVPRVGNNVRISSGARLIGGIVVGNDVTVGANAVVTRDVPDGVTVAGVPARVLRTAPPDESGPDGA